jgi:pilus assembly protein TadC
MTTALLIALSIGIAIFLIVYILGKNFFTRSVAQERLEKMKESNFAPVGYSLTKETIAGQEGAKAQLAQRSMPEKFKGRKFQGVVRLCQLISFVFLGAAAYVKFYLDLPPLFFLGTLGLALFFLFFPRKLQASYIRKRKEAIERDLVDVIDLLVIGLEAGLTFQFTLQKITARYKDVRPYPLIEELKQTLHELQVGINLQEGLKRLAMRCEVPDLKMFSSAVMQSEKFGTSLANTMRVYSDELRDKRRQRIRERIAKIPVKIIPCMLLFLIEIFIIVLGPPVLILRDSLVK